MNYDDRANAIGAWLRDTILPRYRVPEHLDDTTARLEIADMVADLVDAFPVVPLSRFATLLGEAATEIRRTHASRTWPTIAAMRKAVERASRERVAPGAADPLEEPPHIAEMVVEWWTKHRSPFPSLARPHHAARVIRETGATWGELWRRGFPIPFERVADAKAERDPDDARIRDEIRAMRWDSGIRNETFAKISEADHA